MISKCPHCHQELHFTATQRARIDKALAALQPGKILKLACPQCRGAIELESGSTGAAGVLEDILYSTGGGKSAPAQRPEPVRAPPHAPQPPDISWLAKDDFQADDDWVEDVPTALLLVPEKGRQAVLEAFQGAGYQVVVVDSSADAIERMRFGKFTAVVYHTAFEGGDLTAAPFHKHMRDMAMDRRRYIYYLLIGPDFKTFYDLEALAHSANLVVNDAELAYLPLIVKKGLQDYEELFTPLIMTLRDCGKR